MTEAPMFEVGVVAHFEAAHHLEGDFGPATRLHGHTYRVEVAVQGPGLREDGTLCDLGLLQRVVSDAVTPLHYRNLDEVDGLTGQNTTAEVVARHLFERIAPSLRGENVATLRVRVWESPTAYAAFEAPLGASVGE